MKQLLMGNEAFAHAALEAGVNVVAGYPGTPSSELVETVAKLHAAGTAHGVHVEWSTNEKAALELLAGASYCGARVLFTCKQVGLNVASDALMSLNYVGTGGGCVLFVADDPGPISSQTEQDTRRFGAFSKVPVLDPSTPEEGFAMMKAAFELSERYHTPVIVRPTTRINHASTYFDVAEETWARPIPPGGFQKDPKWVIFPKRAYEAHGEINRRLPQIAWDYTHDPAFSRFNYVVEGGGEGAAPSVLSVPRVGIVTGGVSTAYTREALVRIEREAAAAGLAVPRWRLLAVGTPYPFPVETAADFAEGLTDVIVFEELDSVLEEEMLKLAGARGLRLRVHGKLTGAANDRGENTAENIAGCLGRFFDRTAGGGTTTKEQRAEGEAPSCADSLAALVARTIDASDVRYDGPLPVRPPVLCAGCPHRGSFYAVKQALHGREAVLCGDIGCYTLGNAQPLDAVDTCLCMGAGITMAQGFAVAEPRKKQVAFVGDSTFFASALTGIANAVYNGHDVTFAILDNATTAMTGSQPHPGTGVTLMGERRRPIVIEEVLHGLGIQHIGFANPHSVAQATEAARAAIDFEGPSAIIFRAPCIQLKKPDAPVVIHGDVCTGCKKCITSIGCPGIGFDAGLRGPASKERGQAFVDESLCDGCGLCTQVCPFGAIEGTVGFGGPGQAEFVAAMAEEEAASGIRPGSVVQNGTAPGDEVQLSGVYRPDPDPFQTGEIPLINEEGDVIQETELKGGPNETPGQALGEAEGVAR